MKNYEQILRKKTKTDTPPLHETMVNQSKTENISSILGTTSKKICYTKDSSIFPNNQNNNNNRYP
jgi:hypothetical protein